MTRRSQCLWLLLGASALFPSGCSCSRIPESPPGPGVMSPVRHLNTGTTVPTTPADPSNPTTAPPPNTYLNPTPPPPTNNRPGYPQTQPVQPQPQPGPAVTKNSGIVDAPDGPRLKPSFPEGNSKKK